MITVGTKSRNAKETHIYIKRKLKGNILQQLVRTKGIIYNGAKVFTKWLALVSTLKFGR
jgi:hypothetical protein